MTQLQRLWLNNNLLTALPQSVVELGRLEDLEAWNNQLLVLPETLGYLSQLRRLDLWENRLTTLPESVGQLVQLRQLSLNHNHLTTLPEGLRRLMGLERLFLHDNPDLGLPQDVLGPTRNEIAHGGAKPANPASILDYYFKMRGGRRPLNEVRLLLVGRGAAGKTSIVRRLIEDRFVENEPETKGIDIRPWELWCKRDTVRAHVWDFAG